MIPILFENLEALEGGNFHIQLDPENQLKLILSRVEKSSDENAPANSSKIPFSLFFCSPGEHRHLNQGMYKLVHETAGELELFLIPRGSNEEGMTYESIVN